jgi:hypothetical protein
MLALVCCKTIKDVPALKVRLVFIIKSISPFAPSVTVLLLSIMALVEVPEESKDLRVTAYPAVSKVPAVTVKSHTLSNAEPSVTVIPAPLTIRCAISFPFGVRVPVPLKVIVPVYVYPIPTASVTLPDTVIAAVPANVPVNPVQLMDLAPVLPLEMVQVPVDRFVKKTSSALVGTLAPPPPPDVVDHLVPAVPSQAAVPPTQYLSAISYTL